MVLTVRNLAKHMYVHDESLLFEAIYPSLYRCFSHVGKTYLEHHQVGVYTDHHLLHSVDLLFDSLFLCATQNNGNKMLKFLHSHIVPRLSPQQGP